MLRLFRISAVDLVGPASAVVYQDESLLDVRFAFDQLQLSHRRLTKFRLLRKSGALASFEMRGGVVTGVELLGFSAARLDVRVDRFSEELALASEVPALGMELDGSNSRAEVDLMAITQPCDFAIRWAAATHELEIAFDMLASAANFGCASLLFNDDLQLAGIRLRIPEGTNLK